MTIACRVTARWFAPSKVSLNWTAEIGWFAVEPPPAEFFFRSGGVHRSRSIWHIFNDTTSTSRGSLHADGFDFGHFLTTETQFTCAHDSFRLTRVTGADDRSRHRGMVQRPGNCDFPDRPIVALGNLPQPFHQR